MGHWVAGGDGSEVGFGFGVVTEADEFLAGFCRRACRVQAYVDDIDGVFVEVVGTVTFFVFEFEVWT